MKRPHLLPRTRAAIAAITQTGLALLLAGLFAWPALADEPKDGKPPSEHEFQSKLRALEHLQNDAQQAREARSLLRGTRLSSLQVKAIARTIKQEDARYEFALAAYPQTVDPENFYEVYDAFTSFSKVFRLHDQIQQRSLPEEQPRRTGFQPVSDEDMKGILDSIRKEGLDDNKRAICRQVFAGRQRFLSRQVAEIVRLFAFDDSGLEIATLAYDSVIDPENYHLVSGALSFSSSKESLARYIESRNTRHNPRPER